jgi:hypothetical protein
VRAAQELLGAPTIGGGVPWQGVVVERVKEYNTSPRHTECTKMTKNRQFPAPFDLKFTKNAVFLYLKLLNKTYS